jgi:hypothetical protein
MKKLLTTSILSAQVPDFLHLVFCNDYVGKFRKWLQQGIIMAEKERSSF